MSTMKLFHSRITSIIRDLTKHSVIQQDDFYDMNI